VTILCCFPGSPAQEAWEHVYPLKQEHIWMGKLD